MSVNRAVRSVVLLLEIAVLFGLFCLSFTYPVTLGSNSILYSDYGKFYHSQHLYRVGKEIYAPVYFVKNRSNCSRQNERSIENKKARRHKVAFLAGNLNPPFFTLISFPLAYLRYSTALVLWTFLSIVAGCFSILLIQQKLDAQSIHSWQVRLGLCIGLLGYFPTFANLQFGQVSLLLLLPLVLGWRAAHDQHDKKAAIFLGLTASLKPFFGLFLLYFLIRREWKALFIFVAILLLSGLLSIAFLGPNVYHSYYQVCHHLMWAASSWNVSLYGVLLRLIGGWESNTPLFAKPGLLIYAYLTLSALFLWILINFLRPTSNVPAQEKTDLDFSIIVLGALLLSPLAWLYYFPLLSIPFLILCHFSKKGILPISLPLLLSTFLLLTNIPISLVPSSEITASNTLKVFLSSMLDVSALLSFIAMLFLTRQQLTKEGARHFEKIPAGLLLLIGLIVFLPSILGLTQASGNWMRYAERYTREYTLISQD